jgi:hypothetical protein
MNLGKIRGSLGWLFKLQPPAIHLDPRGYELPCRDEDWQLWGVSADGETLTFGDPGTTHRLSTTIGADVVHHFDTDRSRGERRGFLMLKQQMYIQAGSITFRLCFRPGERVAPPPPPPPIEIKRVAVSADFFRNTGIQQRLEAEGFEVNGVIALRLAELELKGWEPVIETDRDGRPTSYYLPDSRPGMELIFIKKRKPAPPPRVRPSPPTPRWARRQP